MDKGDGLGPAAAAPNHRPLYKNESNEEVVCQASVVRVSKVKASDIERITTSRYIPRYILIRNGSQDLRSPRWLGVHSDDDQVRA